ncbi:hypothetical protein [Paractinoplanes abujensis]|uniref:Uncharacterized protein n=1 Tax=Paractinoplanes abujensis TaxID=882441 RepID=A0A7W7CY95_9ACTN|nr:hypothetical protein [Actinoplanes abujensis]MBB4696870.1 hypothetical protein [Actinoplanes abujensis]
MTAVGAIVAGTLVANAEWLIGASADAKVRATKMPKGVKPSVAEQNKGAVVSWSAQEIAPGVKMDRYTITAHSQGAPARAAIVRRVDSTGGESQSITFAADEVAGGTWRWTVRPHFASWTGAESGLSSALKFDPAPSARPADVVAPRPVAPSATTAPVTQPTAEPSRAPTKPAAPVEAPPREEATTAAPAVSSSAGLEPGVGESVPSASGSAPADIPQ